MDKQYPVRQWAHGADLVVSQLEAQGVRQVFGIPGAKIDKVFDSLLDSSIRIIPHVWPPPSDVLPAKRAWRWSPPVRVVLT